MRGLVMREIPRDRVTNLILKEGLLGVINGAVIGLVTAVVGWLWNGNPYFGLVIGLGMLLNLIFAVEKGVRPIFFGCKTLGARRLKINS